MPTSSFEEYPHLDSTQLLQIRRDLADEFPRFLTLFTEHSQHLLAQTHESLAKDNLEQAKIALHSLKGMSGTMGAVRLFQLCQQAETMASTGQLKQQLHLISKIENSLSELDKLIPDALQNR